MAKKTEQNIETVEQPFNFPQISLNDMQGVTVWATNKQEAENKLKKLLQNN